MHHLKWISLLLTILTARGTSATSEDTIAQEKIQVDPVPTKDLEVIARLEKSLLTLLGMEERPRFKGEARVPSYMLKLFQMQEQLNKMERSPYEDEEKEEKEQEIVSFQPVNPSRILGNTVRSFTHTESQDDTFHPMHKMLLRFDATSLPEKEILRHAELRVFHAIHPLAPPLPDTKKTPLPKHDSKHLHWAKVYDVIRPARGSKDAIHKLLDSRVIDARANGTVSFDVRNAVKRWLKKPRINYGIYVEVVPLKSNTVTRYTNATHIRLRRSLNVPHDSDEWVEEQPLLVVHTDDQNIQPREKRNIPASTHHKRPLCRRHRLFVDFRKVEWNTWIVAPPGYDAFYCQGECPYPLSHHMNATNHAVIQNIIHSRYPSRVPSACCVPIKHSAISMLYLDTDKKVVLKTYQDMIVESCGCQ